MKQFNPPTKRWTRARLSKAQADYLTSRARFNVVAAGRRSFKTEASKRRCAVSAWSFRGDNGRFFCCAPTHQQAKDIFWEDMKQLIPRKLLATPRKPQQSISESVLTIRLHNNAIIKIAGLDKPQRIEGGFWDGGVITEFDNTKPGLLDEHIRPMMLRGGWIDIEGVPEGRHLLYKLSKKAQADETGQWAYHHWWTEKVLHLWVGREAAEAEIHSAKTDMDDLVYQQEYRASFINFSGQAYYNFNDSIHARFKLAYNPADPLLFCFDFNKSPGVAVVCQEGPIPQKLNGGRAVRGFRAIGEVYIPRHSTTPMVCRKLGQDWRHHQGDVYVYADATGGAGGSAKVEGSDLELIKKHLSRDFSQFKFRVPSHNPPERARVNSVNNLLRSAAGTHAFAVCPVKCTELIKDLEGTRTVDGGSGELAKKGKENEMFTHLTDALGYMVHFERPLRGKNQITTTNVL